MIPYVAFIIEYISCSHCCLQYILSSHRHSTIIWLNDAFKEIDGQFRDYFIVLAEKHTRSEKGQNAMCTENAAQKNRSCVWIYTRFLCSLCDFVSIFHTFQLDFVSFRLCVETFKGIGSTIAYEICQMP